MSSNFCLSPILPLSFYCHYLCLTGPPLLRCRDNGASHFSVPQWGRRTHTHTHTRTHAWTHNPHTQFTNHRPSSFILPANCHKIPCWPHCYTLCMFVRARCVLNAVRMCVHARICGFEKVGHGKQTISLCCYGMPWQQTCLHHVVPAAHLIWPQGI